MQKTLYEDQLEDVFLKNAHNLKEKRTNQEDIGNYFYISTNTGQSKFSNFYLELQQNIIYCRRKKDEKIIAFMDIKNSFMKLTNLKVINGRPHFGIKFVKKSSYEEIYTQSRQVVLQWYDKLKKQCILTRFRNHFRTKRVLGKGSSAKVFLVERISDEKLFAVKVFSKKKIMNDPKEIQNIIQEIEILRQTSHQKLMQLHEVYEGENYVYCLCDLYRGQSLFQEIVEKGPQSEQKALTIIQQILEGIEYMHSKNYMHRDLKLQNIIFKNKDSLDVGIVDFGFATLEQDYDKIFKSCGTPGYMAPEILEDKNYNCKIDIFSCGVILYTILTGRVPFGGYDVDEIIESNRKAQVNYQILTQLGTSTQTINLLQQMLAYNPNKRISSKEALNHSCFDKSLSVSPLVVKQFFQNDNLKQHQEIICQQNQQNNSSEIPSRIEDLSPSPIQKNRENSQITKVWNKQISKQYF